MLNRTGFALVLCFSLTLVSVEGLSQIVTFADVHPVNDPDSLEQWLNANPKAQTLVQIRTIIALERTRDWLDRGKMGRYLPTLHTLASRTKNPMALAAYEFLSAKKASRYDDFYSATLHGSRALNLFEKLNDTSGQINAHCLLSSIIYDQSGTHTAADSSLTEAHWKQCQTLLATHPNPHDQVYINHTDILRIRNHAKTHRIEQLVSGTLRHISIHPACDYAQSAFELLLSGLYFEKGNFQAAYTQTKKVLSTYPTTDPYELASLYYNLGNTCLQLNRLTEGFGCYENATKFSLASSPVRYNILVGANNNAAVLAERNGLFKKAFSYMARTNLYEIKANRQENSRRMQDLQARYELSRHQRQIDLLQQKQEIARLQSNKYITIICLTIVLLVAISLLAWRLYRNRQQLQQMNHQLAAALADVHQLNTTLEYFIGIIAHDMRKPLISFRSLAELVSDRLRQRAYDDIRLISRAIDQAGAQIETMLDNLLRWALAQREAMPHKPQNLPLGPLLNGVTDLYQNLVQFQNIRILVDCPATLHVWADDNGLQLIVRNLLDNALKHLGLAGEVRITAIVTADRQAQIQIEDTGEGIAPHQLAFLQGFFAGQLEGHVGQKGLGLGLLLVRDFAARNHGYVQVTSQPGHNTCFSVFMPLGVGQLAAGQTEDKLQLHNEL